MGVFTFVTSGLVWLALKYTVGIRVSPEEELAGLDIGEHGNIAYPDFAPAIPTGDFTGLEAAPQPVPAPAAAAAPAAAVPVEHKPRAGAALTKVSVVTRQDRFIPLQNALEQIGVTGLTVTNVFGYGQQKGHEAFFRGVPVEARLLPKLKVEVVVSKVPVDAVVEAARKALYTGHVGDGKIFVYDVENVVKVRTGEQGYDALQDAD